MKKLALVLCLLSLHAFAKDECYKPVTSKFKLEFTGFKFTKKTGVSGVFKETTLKTIDQGSIKDILANAFIFIDTDTIDAGKVARNVNIKKGLFGNIVNGKTIRAVTKEVRRSSIEAELYINGDDEDVVLDYKVDRNMLTLTGSIDLLDLDLDAGFKGLAKICKDYHVGDDGKSKTWSDVELKLTLPLAKCR